MLLLKYYCFIHFCVILGHCCIQRLILRFSLFFLPKTSLKGHHKSKITSYKSRKVPLRDSQHSPKAP